MHFHLSFIMFYIKYKFLKKEALICLQMLVALLMLSE